MKTLKLNHKFAMTLVLSTFFTLFFTACSEDDEVPEIIHEEELITTMEVVLSPKNFGEVVTLSYRDLDGDGPNEAEIQNGVLTANTSYVGTITLLNETEEPAENITLEVEEEGVEHQFFFSNDFGANISYADQDENGNPIGIDFELETAEPKNGSLTVVLRHEPDKNANGVSEGNMENAGGETDIFVVFGIEVQ